MYTDLVPNGDSPNTSPISFPAEGNIDAETALEPLTIIEKLLAPIGDAIVDDVNPVLSLLPVKVECKVATIFLPPCATEPLTTIARGVACE